MNENLKISSIEMKNFRRIEWLKFDPHPGCNELTGKNRAGKTSIAEGVRATLAGGRHRGPDLLRRGTDGGFVEVSLSNGLTARLVLNASGDASLKVLDAEGREIKTPQAKLDKLIDGMMFDPVAFIGLESKKQVEELKRLAGLDFNKLDAERQSLYEQRTAVNQEVKSLAARIEAVPIHADAPFAEVAVLDLVNQRDAAEAHNREVEAHEREVADCSQFVTDVLAKIDGLKQQIEDETAKHAQAVTWLASVKHSTPVRKDVTEWSNKLANLDELNRKSRLNTHRAAMSLEHEAKVIASGKLTAAIDAIDESKRQQLADAKFPLEGLGFNEAGVTFNGLALATASGAEQIEISIAIMSALAGDLRLAMIRHGSDLDTEQREFVRQLCEREGFQLLLETVESDSPLAVTIEGGRIKGQEAEPVVVKPPKKTIAERCRPGEPSNVTLPPESTPQRADGRGDLMPSEVAEAKAAAMPWKK